MNEQAARDIVLAGAIEAADAKREILSEDDRRYASRTAREHAAWAASEQGRPQTPADFAQQRAEQILRKLAQRHRGLAAFQQRPRLYAWFTWGLPLLALLCGAGLDRLGDPHRLDLVSFPLLLIVAWNLAIYVTVLLWALLPRRRTRRLAGRLALLPPPRKLPAVLAAGLLQFWAEWAALAGRLYAARLARTLHLSAALLAAGAIAALYARGMLTQYAAGWESTFLDAEAVRRLLDILFWPARVLFGLPGFSQAEINAVQGAAVPGIGARWVHLYAATLGLLVVGPRLLLALYSGTVAAWLSHHFPLGLDHPLVQRFAGDGATMLVVPYSYQVDGARADRLRLLAAAMLGDAGSVRLGPSVAYGDSVPELEGAGVSLTAGLLSLAATPEPETHGAFLSQLARRGTGRVTVLLDVGPFAERNDESRLRERIELWREFCLRHGLEPEVVDLRDGSMR